MVNISGSRDRKRARPGPLDVEDRLESLITRVGEKVDDSLKTFIVALQCRIQSFFGRTVF